MPLTAEYTWRQTASSVVLEVPLKSASAKAVDVLASETYVKISFERYLLELFLPAPIEDTKCVARVKAKHLVLTLPKASEGLWSDVTQNLSKEDAKLRRVEAIEAKATKEQQLAERAKDRKAEDERKALRKQMALEEDERQFLDHLKAEEKREAEESVYRTLGGLKQGQTAASGPSAAPKPHAESDELDEDELIQEMLAEAREGGGNPVTDFQELEEDEAQDKSSEDSEFEMLEYSEVEDPGAVPEEEEEEEVQYTAPPRAGGKVKFNFTPRIFPTPMRESKQVEEEDWIAKNRSHLRKNPMLKPQLDALDIEDSDPTWLKGKGDDLYRSRDYRAAVNAYTTALELSPDMLPALANRSACYLQLGELVRCLEDCEHLLTTLDTIAMSPDAVPDDPIHGAMRVKALARQGTALCQQGNYDQALKALAKAAWLAPGDQALEADKSRVSKLCKCAELKRGADGKLAGGDLEGALAQYTAALALEPTFVSAVSNRAACLLALGRFKECVDDCSTALALLQVDPAAAAAAAAIGEEQPHFVRQEKQQELLGSSAGLPTGPLPPAGSAKRRTWVLKTIARRGHAYAELGRLSLAVVDFQVATSLAPEDENLKNDLQLLQAQLASQGDAEPESVPTLAPPDSATSAPSPPPSTPPSPPPKSEDVSASPMPPPPAEPVMQPVDGCKTTMAVLSPAPSPASPAVRKGCKVTVHAKGSLVSSGLEFWNTKRNRQTFSYNAGVGAVIKGWDRGCLGMKVGERRLLLIPAEEGYGHMGFQSWGIPPNAALKFELECVSVAPAAS